MKVNQNKAFWQLQIKWADARKRADFYYNRIKKPLKKIWAIEKSLKVIKVDYTLIEQKQKWNRHHYFEKGFKALAAAKLAKIAALKLKSDKLLQSIQEDYHLWNTLKMYY